jgi:hypothetical protein
MKTILDERFAPITSRVCFLEVPLEVAVEASRTWRTGVTVTQVPEPFPESLHRLEPVGLLKSRELWVEMGGWTAYFDNGWQGTDPSATMHLSRVLGCRCLIIDCSPQTMGMPGVEQRFGSVQFWLLGPTGEPPQNFIRIVAVSYDPNVVFRVDGTPQPFEELEAYSARRRRDRFTSEMLERYCRALGVTPFEPESYGRATLIEWEQPWLEPAGTIRGDIQRRSWSLAEAQHEQGIIPGQARSIPG